MTIVAILNTKGGAGKTTTALNLALGRALEGRDVLAVDGDRQGTLLAALGNRGARLPAVAVAQYVDGQTMRQQVLLAAKRYSDIIIDCGGGTDSSVMRAAMILADLVVIPFQPRSYDLWALDDMTALLADARAVKDLRAVACLALADARGQDNAAAAAALPAGLEYLPCPVGRRKAIADLGSQGLSVLEFPRKDEKAAAEIRALLTAVFG